MISKAYDLGCVTQGNNKVTYQLEEIAPAIQEMAEKLDITNKNIRPKVNFSDYT